MRSVCGLPPRSTLTLTRTLPLLFAPHRLGSRREQLLTGFRAERSPFLLRPLLPVPRQILPAPLPFPPLPSSLLRVPPLERPLGRLLAALVEAVHRLVDFVHHLFADPGNLHQLFGSHRRELLDGINPRGFHLLYGFGADTRKRRKRCCRRGQCGH